MSGGDVERRSIDWRGLLDSIGVEWKDRGKNCTRGNVNISCCWCSDDPSFHLSISESVEAFFCYRESGHSGRSFQRLLVRLGVERNDANRLLNAYRNENVAISSLPKPAPSENATRWEMFEPAHKSDAMLAYLHKRGFTSPVDLARKYDLRFAKAGTWAQRLLIPIRWDGQVIAWTGRDIRGTAELRYIAKKVDDQGLVYLPRPPRETVLLVEGHMDALKVASATENMPIGAAALCSKDLNASRIAKLRSLDVRNWLLCLDSTVPSNQVYSMIRELTVALRGCRVERFRLPAGYDDAGDMPETLIRQIMGDGSGS